MKNGIVKFGIVFILTLNMFISVMLMFNLLEIVKENPVTILLTIGQILTGLACGVVLIGLGEAGELN